MIVPIGDIVRDELFSVMNRMIISDAAEAMISKEGYCYCKMKFGE